MLTVSISMVANATVYSTFYRRLLASLGKSKLGLWKRNAVSHKHLTGPRRRIEPGRRQCGGQTVRAGRTEPGRRPEPGRRKRLCRCCPRAVCPSWSPRKAPGDTVAATRNQSPRWEPGLGQERRLPRFLVLAVGQQKARDGEPSRAFTCWPPVSARSRSCRRPRIP